MLCQDSVHVVFLINALNNLQVAYATDVGNVYLTPKTQEKVYADFGKIFLSKKVHTRLLSAHFMSSSPVGLLGMLTLPNLHKIWVSHLCLAYPDLWMCKAIKPDGSSIGSTFGLVDDILLILHDIATTKEVL